MREASIQRVTSETRVSVDLALDGDGVRTIETGIGFLDHMLEQVAVHGLFDLTLKAEGDLEIDSHHTVEDCALALGQAVDEALSERRSIARMASGWVPMDDALAFVALDLSGRPYSVLDLNWADREVAGLPTSLIDHFFESFATSARVNLHARIPYGKNTHHQAEALFKSFARALDAATALDPRREGQVPSSKGTLGSDQAGE